MKRIMTDIQFHGKRNTMETRMKRRNTVIRMNGRNRRKKMSIKEQILDLLRSTGRKGMLELSTEMYIGGFFNAPCSTKHHLAKEGGLAEHSLNVYRTMKQLALCLMSEDEYEQYKDSIVIVALLHDLGKMGDYGKQNYIPKMVRSKTKNKETGEYDMVQSEAEPYCSNPDLAYEEHEIRSLTTACKYIELTEEEYTAILHHNGLHSKLDSPYGNANYCKTKLAYLLHVADMWCSRFVEVEEKED